VVRLADARGDIEERPAGVPQQHLTGRRPRPRRRAVAGIVPVAFPDSTETSPASSSPAGTEVPPSDEPAGSPAESVDAPGSEPAPVDLVKAGDDRPGPAGTAEPSHDETAEPRHDESVADESPAERSDSLEALFADEDDSDEDMPTRAIQLPAVPLHDRPVNRSSGRSGLWHPPAPVWPERPAESWAVWGTDRPDTPSEQPKPAKQRPRRDLAVMLGAIAIVVIVVAAAVALALSLRHRSTARGSAAPTTSASASTTTTGAKRAAAAVVNEATAWIVANLSSADHVITDSVTAGQLVSQGFANVTGIDTAATSQVQIARDESQFIVATPSIRSAVARNRPLSDALTASAPAAMFNTGPQRVEVRQVLSGAHAASLQGLLTTDLTSRKQAATGILSNSAITVAPSARPVLLAGALDLRAATAIVYLADRTPIRLVTVQVNPPERAAGRPARIIQVEMTDPINGEAALTTLTSAYQPSTVVTDKANPKITDIQWPVSAIPPPTLN
jgi:hypothetical protein